MNQIQSESMMVEMRRMMIGRAIDDHDHNCDIDEDDDDDDDNNNHDWDKDDRSSDDDGDVMVRTIRWNGYVVFMIHDDMIIHTCTGRKQSRKLGRYKMDLIYRIQPSSRYVQYLIVASSTYFLSFGAYFLRHLFPLGSSRMQNRF